VQAATAEYRAEQDILKPFIEECCEVDTAAWVAFEDLYAKYETWATAQRERVMTKQALGRLFTERGYPIAKVGGAKGRNGLCLRMGTSA